MSGVNAMRDWLRTADRKVVGDGPFRVCRCDHVGAVHGDRRSGLLGRIMVLWGGPCLVEGCLCVEFGTDA